jgi:hypothetical protein
MPARGASTAKPFAVRPAVGDHCGEAFRYKAACAVALAAAGKEQDATNLDDGGRARLRRQALGWLRPDLATFTKLQDERSALSRASVRQTLRYWVKDPHLISLRRTKSHKELREPERETWQALMADFCDLLERDRQAKPQRDSRLRRPPFGVPHLCVVQRNHPDSVARKTYLDDGEQLDRPALLRYLAPAPRGQAGLAAVPGGRAGDL